MYLMAFKFIISNVEMLGQRLNELGESIHVRASDIVKGCLYPGSSHPTAQQQGSVG